ncbi:hypothetical protein UNDYM_2280 [Undibacterium sp. YM2]|uniref:hypothetical protein n=1 Tax=Undibacterium sp. YM2 TaxID=2058625 RepID=UPI001331C439|nr:hypothetical protein [Undibacterium sp. YM2]BBB66533.1 hypothetical protein UNDYM_2280 [Undibacterium sp. YM2]
MTAPMKPRAAIRTELDKWLDSSGFEYKAGMTVKEVSDQACKDFPTVEGRNYFALSIIAEVLLLNKYVIAGDEKLKQAKVYKTFNEAVYLHN